MTNRDYEILLQQRDGKIRDLEHNIRNMLPIMRVYGEWVEMLCELSPFHPLFHSPGYILRHLIKMYNKDLKENKNG